MVSTGETLVRMVDPSGRVSLCTEEQAKDMETRGYYREKDGPPKKKVVEAPVVSAQPAPVKKATPAAPKKKR